MKVEADKLRTGIAGYGVVGQKRRMYIDENQSLDSQYGVRSVPTTVIEENGVEVDRFMGALPKDQVIQKLNG